MKKLITGLLPFALAACGTLFSGTTQNITIDSNVKGVKIYDSGAVLCETPCNVRLSRQRGEKNLIAKKEGYEDARVLLRSSINAISLINIFTIYGFSTDLTTGSLWEYSPNSFYVNMMRDEKLRKREEQEEREIRRYVLSNWPVLRQEAQMPKGGEYMNGLKSMTDLPAGPLKNIIKNNASPVLAIEVIIEECEKNK